MTSSRKRDDLMQDVEPESGRDSERFHAEVRGGRPCVSFVQIRGTQPGPSAGLPLRTNIPLGGSEGVRKLGC